MLSRDSIYSFIYCSEKSIEARKKTKKDALSDSWRSGGSVRHNVRYVTAPTSFRYRKLAQTVGLRERERKRQTDRLKLKKGRKRQID